MCRIHSYLYTYKKSTLRFYLCMCTIHFGYAEQNPASERAAIYRLGKENMRSSMARSKLVHTYSLSIYTNSTIKINLGLNYVEHIVFLNVSKSLGALSSIKLNRSHNRTPRNTNYKLMLKFNVGPQLRWCGCVCCVRSTQP